ncbi:hypothetical protein VTI74DRAFT_6155 [Chaetomium olivicolor]
MHARMASRVFGGLGLPSCQISQSSLPEPTGASIKPIAQLRGTPLSKDDVDCPRFRNREKPLQFRHCGFSSALISGREAERGTRARGRNADQIIALTTDTDQSQRHDKRDVCCPTASIPITSSGREPSLGCSTRVQRGRWQENVSICGTASL